ncbi:DUF6093 family protein [Microbacterium hydrocarbonoxydans]|uniref:DUF6093 family protein n=1 Tax=Microbacterium hydrocarbonoxydans TaxID=273678 RepID=UPI003D98C4D8
MTLGADIDAALPGLRAEAESRMTDNIEAGRYADRTDPTSGNAVRALVELRYSGIGRVRWGSREVTNANGPSMPVAVQEPYLSVPFGTHLLLIGDEIAITASKDPVLAGRRFRIAGEPVAGQVTAHRYPLEALR